MKIKAKVDNIFTADDNRKILISCGEIKKAFDEEYSKRCDEIYASITQDITVQLMATVLFELNKEFGFGKKRLQRVQSGTESLFKLMEEGILGKKFTTEDLIKYMKEKYDIELDAQGKDD